jgi:hypothetical protein
VHVGVNDRHAIDHQATVLLAIALLAIALLASALLATGLLPVQAP